MRTELDALTKQLETDEINPDSQHWRVWPGGWPGEIATSLIDAVFSARAVYKTQSGGGIHSSVSRWRNGSDTASLDSLSVLRAAISTSGPLAWAENFGNTQHSPGRSRTRYESPWKAATVLEACDALTSNNIQNAADVIRDNVPDVSRLLRSIPGIGPATTSYFFMLLGFPDVKADVMIRRYVGRAISLDDQAEPSQAADLVKKVANSKAWPVLDLEHSIWNFERSLTKPTSA